MHRLGSASQERSDFTGGGSCEMPTGERKALGKVCLGMDEVDCPTLLCPEVRIRIRKNILK